MPKLGIEVLKECVLALNGAFGAGFALADGFQIGDIPEFIALAKVLPPAIRDRALIIPQWEDLDDAERADLSAYTATAISLPPSAASVENFLETALDIVYACSAFAALWQPAAPATAPA